MGGGSGRNAGTYSLIQLVDQEYMEKWRKPSGRDVTRFEEMTNSRKIRSPMRQSGIRVQQQLSNVIDKSASFIEIRRSK
jgi:hypothetical protein